jgi:hypothetical protein
MPQEKPKNARFCTWRYSKRIASVLSKFGFLGRYIANLLTTSKYGHDNELIEESTLSMIKDALCAYQQQRNQKQLMMVVEGEVVERDMTSTEVTSLVPYARMRRTSQQDKN